ncbi:hypothetical protein [Sphingobacterium faecium]|uniref:hypothetical protein n=1 Tax=Sphingobacterium faecium TaxID=34087 RepID=UPI0032089830
MSKIKLIEQMQETLDQLKRLEVQPMLNDIPFEILLQETIAQFPTHNMSTQLLESMYAFVQLALPHLKDWQSYDVDVPDYVNIEWICTQLDIRRSTFYKSVNRILLFPVLKVGRRPYFLKSDVIALFNKTRGMGPHVLGKLAGKVRKI